MSIELFNPIVTHSENCYKLEQLQSNRCFAINPRFDIKLASNTMLFLHETSVIIVIG